MGPPLDQLSFLLLCLAFSRNQMLNLGLRPYSGLLCSLRSARLRRRFPQYEPRILHEFATSFTYAAPSDQVRPPRTRPAPPADPNRPHNEVLR